MRNKLLEIQRPALLDITWCFRTVSTAALQVLAGCSPLDLEVERETTWVRLYKYRKKEEYYGGPFDPNEIERITYNWLVSCSKI